MNIMQELKHKYVGKYYLEDSVPCKIIEVRNDNIVMIFWDDSNFEWGRHSVSFFEFNDKKLINKEMFDKLSLEQYKVSVEYLGRRYKDGL